jgi:CubicO group peptidase (beta-lactamase class C family)
VGGTRRREARARAGARHDERTLARAIAEQVRGTDLVLGFEMRWGLGFMLSSDALPFGPHPRTFGHGGWGGSLGFADRDARASWSYVGAVGSAV